MTMSTSIYHALSQMQSVVKLLKAELSLTFSPTDMPVQLRTSVHIILDVNLPQTDHF